MKWYDSVYMARILLAELRTGPACSMGGHRSLSPRPASSMYGRIIPVSYFITIMVPPRTIL